MNKQGPNGIGWCTHTWNPCTGCEHGCSYCFARVIAERFGDFRPRFHEERLEEPYKLKKPARIFVGSMTDMLGAWWKNNQIAQVIEVCRACPQHTFLWLSKRPERYQEFYNWPANCWLGATITDEFDAADAAVDMRHALASVRFLSAEPLLGMPLNISLVGIQWLIVGPLTGPGARQPPRKAVELLLNSAQDYDVPVYMKKALVWEPRREEFPR